MGLMGDSLVTDEAGESQKLKSQGFDGILLMKQFMDEIHYERGGTEVHMRKRPGG